MAIYPSENQYRFASDLLNGRSWKDLSTAYRDRLDELRVSVPDFLHTYDADESNIDFDSIVQNGPIADRRAIGALIDTLKSLPRISDGSKLQASDFPNIISSYYAVPTEEGHLAFYNVNVPGPMSGWNGRIFVDVMASDNHHPIRGEAARTILEKIAVDPVAAAQRYGQEIGQCARCHRTLTNEESRAVGLGPYCRTQF